MSVQLFACITGTINGYLPLERCALYEVKDAAHAAVESLRYRSGDEYFVDLAAVLLVEVDPVNEADARTTQPVAAAGFALGAVNVPNPDLRFLEGRIHDTLEAALEAARAARSQRNGARNGRVFDVVALSIVDTDLARLSAG